MSDQISTRVHSLFQAYCDLIAARSALQAYLEINFPVASPVSWKRGRHVQFGRVVDCGSLWLLVTNARTGATYRVSVFDILLSEFDVQDIP